MDFDLSEEQRLLRDSIDRLAELKRKWDPEDLFRHTKRVSA